MNYLMVSALIVILADTSLAVPAAHAQASPMSQLIKGNVQVMSNYVGRGLAQSVGDPAVEGEIDFNPGQGLYAGIGGNSIRWVDLVYPGDRVCIEIDGWVGYRAFFGNDWTAKLGVLRMQFPGRYVSQTPPVVHPDTTETFGYVGWKTLSAQINYAVTDSSGTPNSKGSVYAKFAAKLPVAAGWVLSAHLGFKRETGTNPKTGEHNRANDYTDYKLSATHSLWSNMSLIVAHTWTNANPTRYALNGYDVAGHHTWVILEKDF